MRKPPSGLDGDKVSKGRQGSEEKASAPGVSRSADQLYSQPRESISDFVFDQSVVAVFEDMISRSVPGYSTLVSMLPVISRTFLQASTHCYDLGCSLGAATLAIHKSTNVDHVNFIAVDNSEAMIDQCRTFFEQHADMACIEIQQADVFDVEIQNASLVVMNFTLQFIAESRRKALVEKIFSGMNQGGAFLLSEKIHYENVQEQERLTDLHHQFKKANGYSDLEISQKRAAIEKVMIPETIEAHRNRLLKAGFSEVFVWFQCFNFVSILAIK